MASIAEMLGSLFSRPQGSDDSTLSPEDLALLKQPGVFNGPGSGLGPAAAVRQPAPAPTAQAFGPIMDLAGKLRPTNTPEAGRLDRYAQGISARADPNYSPLVDLPMNMALATGYEGAKGAAMSDTPVISPLAKALLAHMGYEIKDSGQATSPASLGNVYALYRGLTGS